MLYIRTEVFRHQFRSKRMQQPTRILARIMVASTLISCLLAGPTHTIEKRSFFDIQCKGVYDKSIFARLDRICEDCYNLFREPQLHQLCRNNCFSSEYFSGCVEVLLLTEEAPDLKKMVEYIGGK
uniref:Ion transport peptide-like protein n=1 Tax=Clastoptera arizonana TaxID=38151 RepID=A0A1B6CH59_9HEMI